MKLQLVTLYIDGSPVEFVVYDKVIMEGQEYVLLIVKILYLEMSKAIVDEKALKNAVNVYRRREEKGKIQYIKVDDEKQIQEAWKWSLHEGKD